MIKVEVINPTDASKSVWLTLPATVEELQAGLNELSGATSDGETPPYEISRAETDIPHVEYLLQNDKDASVSLDEVNLLAYMAANMDSDERALLCDILIYKGPDSFDECIGIAASVRAGTYEVWRDTPEERDVGVEYINRRHPKLPEIVYANLNFDGVALDAMEQKGGAIIDGQYYIHNLETVPTPYDSSKLGTMLKQERREYEGRALQSQDPGGMPPMA